MARKNTQMTKNRQSACRMLMHLGYQVREAKDGKGALEVLACGVFRCRPHLLADTDQINPR
jgi:hypothetical protein